MSVSKPHSELRERVVLGPPSREGMVTVYDHEGEYVGCMGRESWDWLLEQGYDHLRGLEEQYEVQRDKLVTLDAEYDHLKEQKETLEGALREARNWIIEEPDTGDITDWRGRLLNRIDRALSYPARHLTPEAKAQWREMVDPYLEPNPASEPEAS